MVAVLLAIGTALVSGINFIFSFVKEILLISWDFLIQYYGKIFKVVFFFYIILYALTGISFVLYHIYFGPMLALSWMVGYKTLNLIHVSVLAFLLFLIYDFLYN